MGIDNVRVGYIKVREKEKKQSCRGLRKSKPKKKKPPPKKRREENEPLFLDISAYR